MGTILHRLHATQQPTGVQNRRQPADIVTSAALFLIAAVLIMTFVLTT